MRHGRMLFVVDAARFQPPSQHLVQEPPTNEEVASRCRTCCMANCRDEVDPQHHICSVHLVQQFSALQTFLPTVRRKPRLGACRSALQRETTTMASASLFRRPSAQRAHPRRARYERSAYVCITKAKSLDLGPPVTRRRADSLILSQLCRQPTATDELTGVNFARSTQHACAAGRRIAQVRRRLAAHACLGYCLVTPTKPCPTEAATQLRGPRN
ncbi:hypothetical protein BKA63DRAFT_115796 [Paraphoma chrysanthemicola]|nr:hypothetical protein BKA63DRAFT_115796 [Paraphoma chrysanthemicola]